MVARLKLKGIDGRAPPGVNHRKLAAATLLFKAARKGEVVCLFVLVPLWGDTLKLRGVPKASATKPMVERHRRPG